MDTHETLEIYDEVVDPEPVDGYTISDIYDEDERVAMYAVQCLLIDHRDVVDDLVWELGLRIPTSHYHVRPSNLHIYQNIFGTL
jgi:hypothetical protein